MFVKYEAPVIFHPWKAFSAITGKLAGLLPKTESAEGVMMSLCKTVQEREGGVSFTQTTVPNDSGPVLRASAHKNHTEHHYMCWNIPLVGLLSRVHKEQKWRHFSGFTHPPRIRTFQFVTQERYPRRCPKAGRHSTFLREIDVTWMCLKFLRAENKMGAGKLPVTPLFLYKMF